MDTGIQLIIPLGYYGRLAAKSGISKKYSLDIGAGVIDIAYTGPEKAALPLLEEIQEIAPTTRNDRGFRELEGHDPSATMSHQIFSSIKAVEMHFKYKILMKNFIYDEMFILQPQMYVITESGSQLIM